jgi:hypothetical protein
MAFSCLHAMHSVTVTLEGELLPIVEYQQEFAIPTVCHGCCLAAAVVYVLAGAMSLWYVHGPVSPFLLSSSFVLTYFAASLLIQICSVSPSMIM